MGAEDAGEQAGKVIARFYELNRAEAQPGGMLPTDQPPPEAMQGLQIPETYWSVLPLISLGEDGEVVLGEVAQLEAGREVREFLRAHRVEGRVLAQHVRRGGGEERGRLAFVHGSKCSMRGRRVGSGRREKTGRGEPRPVVRSVAGPG